MFGLVLQCWLCLEVVQPAVVALADAMQVQLMYIISLISILYFFGSHNHSDSNVVDQTGSRFI